MPFKNEHAARQMDPGGFTRFRRGTPKGFPAGVSVIFGVKAAGGSEIQSVRFDRKKWTVPRAKKWLKDRGFKTGSFEEATGKEAEDFALSVDVQKIDEEQRIVGGWLYVCTDKDGNQVVDHSGEVIEIDELEKAAHEYLIDSRAGKMSHRGDAIADLVQLWVSRKETRSAIGIPEGILPDGVFVAYKIHETEAGNTAWEAVKSGELRMLSLGGGCRREVINA